MLLGKQVSNALHVLYKNIYESISEPKPAVMGSSAPWSVIPFDVVFFRIRILKKTDPIDLDSFSYMSHKVSLMYFSFYAKTIIGCWCLGTEKCPVVTEEDQDNILRFNRTNSHLPPRLCPSREMMNPKVGIERSKCIIYIPGLSIIGRERNPVRQIY